MMNWNEAPNCEQTTAPLIELVAVLGKQQQEMLAILEELVGPAVQKDGQVRPEPLGHIEKLRLSLETRTHINATILADLKKVRNSFV